MTAIGLPSDKISLILAIDWFLDRFRTAINVMGDSIGCAVVQANISFDYGVCTFRPFSTLRFFRNFRLTTLIQLSAKTHMVPTLPGAE